MTISQSAQHLCTFMQQKLFSQYQEREPQDIVAMPFSVRKEESKRENVKMELKELKELKK